MTLSNIFKLSPDELESIYRKADPGPIPRGDTAGKASRYPGTILSPIERVLLRLFWSGKVFNHQRGGEVTLLNKTPLGRIIPAKVYFADSKVDGRMSIIIDYTDDLGMPIVGGLVGNIRDEIRLVAPNLYLGYAFLKHGDKFTNMLFFALDSSQNTVPLPITAEAAPAAQTL